MGTCRHAHIYAFKHVVRIILLFRTAFLAHKEKKKKASFSHMGEEMQKKKVNSLSRHQSKSQDENAGICYLTTVQ